eukprot:3598521-Amphidinium_carterae.2
MRTATVQAENRVDERFERLDQHIVLVDEILGSHTGSIRRMSEETHQREEAQVYSSMGRRAHQLSELVHELYMIRARENDVPPAQRPALRPVAPNPKDQHGVIVHGYTGTPHFRMFEPPASTIESTYRDPTRDYIDDDH